ncbi:methyltransferase [Actinomycetospora sp. NBRC 106375]|uniref:methyltransferase n=1 Tax=Actinomycetospora sp. NBRC 106375 TaxID=3032207 RepID=UPI0024A48804|nr:methyltransferase [Actinomycetospora sp. NBRC 106375]GLZ44372.1 methyltransferase [Actinomycetospora sp. NBRC 106375]
MTSTDTTAVADPAERDRLLELLTAYWRTQIVGLTAELGLADELADGPRDVAELAARTGTDAGQLARLLRALDGFGLVAGLDDGRYATTPAGRWLERDRPGGIHARALLVRRLWYPSWDGLLASLRDGRSGFEHRFGAPLFEHLAAHPDTNALFDATMSGSTGVAADEVAAVYDTTWARTLVDLGGGTGALLGGLLRRNPDARGVLVETGPVAERARATLAAGGLDGRCEVRVGDFFADVLGGADLYLLSWIVHDSDDEPAGRLLARCRRAMGPRARLLVLEIVLPERPEPMTAGLSDLHMMAVVGGRERTEAEYDRLFAAAGMERVATIPTTGLRAVLEVRVAG